MKTILVAMVVLAALIAARYYMKSNNRSPNQPPRVNEKDLKGVVRTSLDSPTPTKAQLDRRSKSNAAIKAMSLPVLESLPVVEEETTITPRTSKEIAQRCVALAICALKGESNDQALTNEVINRFSASGFFSPKEKAFIANGNATKQELVNFAWQYERVHVLLWALGYVDAIKPPNETCDVVKEMSILKNSKTFDAFLAGAKPRSMNEILDGADLYYRLHWATDEFRLKKTKSPAADGEIVMERHYALNWLIRYMQQEWDEVTTDT